MEKLLVRRQGCQAWTSCPIFASSPAWSPISQHRCKQSFAATKILGATPGSIVDRASNIHFKLRGGGFGEIGPVAKKLEFSHRGLCYILARGQTNERERERDCVGAGDEKLGTCSAGARRGGLLESHQQWRRLTSVWQGGCSGKHLFQVTLLLLLLLVWLLQVMGCCGPWDDDDGDDVREHHPSLQIIVAIAMGPG